MAAIKVTNNSSQAEARRAINCQESGIFVIGLAYGSENLFSLVFMTEPVRKRKKNTI